MTVPSAAHRQHIYTPRCAPELRGLIDMLDDAVIVTSPDLDAPGPVIDYVNAAFERQTGYSAVEVLGRSPRLLQGPKTDRAVLDRMRHDLVHAGRFEGEIINHRKDGSAFLVEWQIKPMHDADGRICGWVSVQRDVTAQRRAANEQRRLAREVDHRAKNALALVQGIVRLTRADDAHRFARAVEGRVEALASAHALLSEARWCGVAIDRLVGAARAHISIAGKVVAEGPAVLLPPSLVQPVALMLHELMTNAVQHGALRGARGELRLDWTTPDTPPSLVINWQERGGPPPASERRSGFGLTMVKSIVARQLGGSFDEDWSSAGFSATVAIPLKRAGRLR